MSGRQLMCAVSLALSGCVVIDASESGGRADPVRVGRPLTYTITVDVSTADTCDPATHLCAHASAITVMSHPTLRIRGLDTPPGDDRLAFRGALALPAPITPALDPVANGVRFLVRTRAGGVVADANIAPGRFDPRARVGWKVDRRVRPTRWTHVDRTASPPGGIVKVQIRNRASRAPGLIGVALRGRKGSY